MFILWYFLCVCMYVCMYIYIYIYRYTRTKYINKLIYRQSCAALLAPPLASAKSIGKSSRLKIGDLEELPSKIVDFSRNPVFFSKASPNF